MPLQGSDRARPINAPTNTILCTQLVTCHGTVYTRSPVVPVCQLSERKETIISTVLRQVVHVAYFDHSIIICGHLILSILMASLSDQGANMSPHHF